MAKKRNRPKTIILPDGTRLKATVMLINTYDRERPKNVTIIHDEQKIHLAGGEHFLIAYVPENMLIPDNRTRPELD